MLRRANPSLTAIGLDANGLLVWKALSADQNSRRLW
jgi:hypothetical protein